jgi:hypothetical protein
MSSSSLKLKAKKDWMSLVNVGVPSATLIVPKDVNKNLPLLL